MRTTTLNKIMTVLMIAGALSACGNKKTVEGSSDGASRSTDSQIGTDGQKAWAYCNAKVGTEIGIKNRAYVENNKVRNDLLWAKISSLPESFKDNQTYIQMFRWKANSSGQVYLDPTPLKFRVVYGNQAITDMLSHMNHGSIAQAVSSLQASSMKAFFDATVLQIDLRDPYAEFDVLKVVLYNKTHQALDQVDILIPVFAAHPSSYAVEADGSPRPQTLKNLHPFLSMSSQSWSQSHYQTLANGNCF